MSVELRQHNGGEHLILSWPYSTTATVNGRAERFGPRALEFLPPVLVLRQHDDGRVLALAEQEWISNTDEALTMTIPVAAMPDTTHVADVLAEVRAGVVAGVSPGFVPREQHNDAGARVVTRAQMIELSVVTVPAYPDSAVELRAPEVCLIRATETEAKIKADRLYEARLRWLRCA